jgi:hypothetical protein
VVLDVSGDAPGVEFVRVEYPVQETADAILRSELPDDFAEYLLTGGKPAAATAPAAR